MEIKKKKVCPKCEKEKEITEFYYSKRRKQYMLSCKKCNSKQCVEYQKKSNYRKSLKYIFYQRAYNIKRDNTKNVPVMDNLREYLTELWKEQNGLCFYTNKKMELENFKSNNLFMTVDKIIPSKGYVEGNIALCCSIVNKMKQNLSLKDLKYWCEEILNSIKIKDL